MTAARTRSEPPARSPVVRKGRRGIQSIEVGGRLLNALAARAAPMMLRDLARAAGMAPSKAHPYLVSFGTLGLIEQDPLSGRYALGPLALRMGLVALQSLNPLRLAMPALGTLVDRIHHTIALAVWGPQGATVVHLAESNYPIHVNLRVGALMSPLTTATGRVFAAFLPPKVTEAAIEQELLRLEAGTAGAKRPGWPEIEAGLADVRRRGIARAVGDAIPGVNAFGVPVFNHLGQVSLAITALGPSGTFDATWGSPIAAALRETSADLSFRLGYSGGEASGAG